jgi:hypothetical protein
MQSTTRWCLNEGSMSSCTDDQKWGVPYLRINLCLFPKRPRKFTGQAVPRFLPRDSRTLILGRRRAGTGTPSLVVEVHLV